MAGRTRNPLVHGTLHGYYSWRCHCDLCRAASTAYARKSRERTARPKKKHAKLPHGERSTYAKGCRCRMCKIAATNYELGRKRRHAAKQTPVKKVLFVPDTAFEPMFEVLMATLLKGRSIDTYDGSRKKIEARVAALGDTIEGYALRSNRKLDEIIDSLSLKEMIRAYRVERGTYRRVAMMEALVRAIYALGLRESLETLRLVSSKSSADAEKSCAAMPQDTSREASADTSMAKKPASQDATTQEQRS
jgi:hypothetical protein